MQGELTTDPQYEEIPFHEAQEKYRPRDHFCETLAKVTFEFRFEPKHPSRYQRFKISDVETNRRLVQVVPSTLMNSYPVDFETRRCILALVFYIVISGAAFHSAGWLHNRADALNSPYWTITQRGKKCIMVYILAAIPIACLNGYLLHEWGGLLISGVLTWLGISISRFILPGSAAFHFVFFSFANILWTFINVFSH